MTDQRSAPDAAPAEMPERECRFVGDPEYISYGSSVCADTLETVQVLAQWLKQEAERRVGWLYTTMVKAECDPAGWCRATVEWTERRALAQSGGAGEGAEG